jgi:DNA-binding transcriptional regulator YhcF (GntR family)
METNQLMEDTITVLSLDNEKLKRKYFFATKDNHQLKKDLKKAIEEIDKLELEYKRLTTMLAKYDRGRK